MEQVKAELTKTVQLLKTLLEGPVADNEQAKMQIRLALVQLKLASRNLHELAFDAKESLTNLKKALDGAQLSLQSAQYEKALLEKELVSLLAIPAYENREFSVPPLVSAANDAKAVLSDKLVRIKSETNARLSKTYY